jgi:hypothetical protein
LNRVRFFDIVIKNYKHFVYGFFKEYLGKKPDLSKPFAKLKVKPEDIPDGVNSTDLDGFETIYNTHIKVSNL